MKVVCVGVPDGCPV